MNYYFGPLSREYCVYFYYLSVIFGLMFAFTAMSAIYVMMFHSRKVNKMFIVNTVLVLSNLFLGYFANRLLNTMCVRSV